MSQSNGKTKNFNRFLKASIRKLCRDDMADWDQVLGQILMAYRCCSHTSVGESPLFLVYSRDLVLPIHKLIKPVRPCSGEVIIAQKNEKTQVTLTTAAKSLEKAREQQKKPSKNRPSQHNFQIGDLGLVKKYNKGKLEFKWELGYRIVGFPAK